MRGLPYFHQKTDYTCGPASLRMILGFFGVHISENKLAVLTRTDKTGTLHKNLILAARKEGFYCYVHEKSSLLQLEHFLSIGLPVIVHFIEPSSEVGHYAVVISSNKRRLFFHDPWNGNRFSLPRLDFLERWHGDLNQHKSTHWIMVLSKQPFSVGKSYAPLS